MKTFKDGALKSPPTDLSVVKKENLKSFTFVNFKNLENNNNNNNINPNKENDKDKEKEKAKEKERLKIQKILNQKKIDSKRFDKHKLIQINGFERFKKSKNIF
jgi:hypothetical protein